MKRLSYLILAGVVVCMSGVHGLRVQPVDAATSAAPTVSIRRNSALNFDVFTGDMNGDGVVDAVATDPYAASGSAIVVALGNGDGTFKPPIRSTVKGNVLALGDFNADGKLDVAIQP